MKYPEFKVAFSGGVHALMESLYEFNDAIDDDKDKIAVFIMYGKENEEKLNIHSHISESMFGLLLSNFLINNPALIPAVKFSILASTAHSELQK